MWIDIEAVCVEVSSSLAQNGDNFLGKGVILTKHSADDYG